MNIEPLPALKQMGRTLVDNGANLDSTRDCALILIRAGFLSRHVAAYIDEARNEARHYLAGVASIGKPMVGLTAVAFSGGC